MKIDEKQKEILSMALKKLSSTTASLYSMVQDGSLDNGMNEIMPSLIETHFCEVAKALDYQSTLAKERENRFNEIRKANTEIRALEEKLAGSTVVSGISSTLRSLADIVSDWWDKDGFHHISDPRFIYGNFNCDLAFMLDMRHSDEEDTDEYIQKLKNSGYIFGEGLGRDYESRLIDNESNRKLLTELIKGRFPTARIVEWKNAPVTKKGSDAFIIRYVSIVIYELTEIRKE